MAHCLKGGADGRGLDHVLGDLAVEKLDILGESVEFAQMPIDCGPLVVRQQSLKGQSGG